MMSPETRYLREISRSLTRMTSLKKQKAQPVFWDQFRWLKRIGLLILAVLVLSSIYLFNRLYKTASYQSTNIGNDGSTLGIDNLVKQVQSEISKSEQERKEQKIAPMFELKSFELEISFVVKKTLTQTGSIKYEAVAVDNQLQTGDEKTHRLKLTMDVIPDEGSVGPSKSQPPTKGEILESPPLKKGQNK